MITIPPALAAMAAVPQWICYRAVPSTTRPGKVDKVPTDPRTGYPIDSQAPTSWMTSADACDVADEAGLGVGFVFTAWDPFFFVDLDDALGADGTWLPHVAEVLSCLRGAAVERSISGRGLHIFGRCAPHLLHGTRAPGIHAELYTSGRFVALGELARGDASTDCTAGLTAVIERWFPPAAAGERDTTWTTAPRPEYTGPADDDELIVRACRSKSAAATFGAVASFADLWSADVIALSRAYPDPARGYDASRADAALARHLAFWAGGDCDRIERLMRRSALAREKWDTHSSYLTRTITGACSQAARVYDRPRPATTTEAPAATTPAAEGRRTGYQYLPPDAQHVHFAGCTWIESLDRILMPDGALLKSSVFRVRRGGYVFALDDTGHKTTRNAWEAFTESQHHEFPRASSVTFEPDQPWDVPIVREGRVLANAYRPVPTERRAGDPTPFLAHVRRLLPIGDDAEILLSYLAAVVQYPGRKFAWCPVVQGCPGNGKTLITNCLRRAIGSRYTHDARASELASRFNGWLSGRILVIVDDFRADRETVEILKPMITSSEGIEIQRKGQDQTTERICCNFILTSNHRNAVPKTDDDRRFAVFFCAQQSAADLVRDGMDSRYFTRMFAWLESGGYAIVHDYLATFPIAAHRDPTIDCTRAPLTSSTAEAIDASRSPAQQEVEHAVASESVGFRGGWVSGTYLDLLLRDGPHRLSRYARAEMLRELGYQLHPALTDHGRTPQSVAPDGRRAVLWVHRDRADLLDLPASAAVLRYTQAQDAPGAAPPTALRVFQ